MFFFFNTQYNVSFNELHLLSRIANSNIEYYNFIYCVINVFFFQFSLKHVKNVQFCLSNCLCQKADVLTDKLIKKRKYRLYKERQKFNKSLQRIASDLKISDRTGWFYFLSDFILIWSPIHLRSIVYSGRYSAWAQWKLFF